ncbi:hypothetical protein FGO68_gene12454 [Halteria grandinella]|uniref:Uncharacterized protein n=1 Tax=Halteria grandinella TaxID=5974 RepID=A0A8J8T6Y2_HALGN|nr:hypothetical protein FGO68_gene12454 [Halteria grandinella]
MLTPYFVIDSNENTREDDRGQQGGERKAERSKRNHKSKSSSAGRRSHTPEAKCGSEMKTAEEELHVGDITTGGLVGVDCDKNKMSTNDNDNSWND